LLLLLPHLLSNEACQPSRAHWLPASSRHAHVGCHLLLLLLLQLLKALLHW
jgi:hypothetical protein